MLSGSLWNYYRDEVFDVNNNASDGKLLKYKTKIVWKTPERPERPPKTENPDRTQPPRPLQPPVPTLKVEFTISLKYFTTGQLWSRTWFIIGKGLHIDRTL